MKGKHIVIAGGTGFMGTYMAARWAGNNKVTILTRNHPSTQNNSYALAGNTPGVELVEWDARTTGPWVQALEGCDLLINLVGRTVNCRYTAQNKVDIMNSRIDATKVLGEVISGMQTPPQLWINAASATIYRHAIDKPQDEYTGEIQDDFSVQVCKNWEAAFNDITLPHTRKAILRTAIVLGKGGALVPYSRLARFGLGGRQGSGRQMFSWVHIDDVCSIIEWLYEHGEQSGVYNVSAPQPVPNAVFMSSIRKALHMPFGLPAPAWLLKIAAAIIGTEPELLLKSRWVIPARLQREGYVFKYPKLYGALTNIVGKEGLYKSDQ